MTNNVKPNGAAKKRQRAARAIEEITAAIPPIIEALDMASFEFPQCDPRRDPQRALYCLSHVKERFVRAHLDLYEAERKLNRLIDQIAPPNFV